MRGTWSTVAPMAWSAVFIMTMQARPSTTGASARAMFSPICQKMAPKMTATTGRMTKTRTRALFRVKSIMKRRSRMSVWDAADAP